MKRAIYFGLGGLLLGALVSWVLASKIMVSGRPILTPSPVPHQMESMSMDDMVSQLKNKNGDAFDKEFLKGMIDHHNGAIEMARMVEQQAKHEELKDMAKDVINTQGSEIKKMQQWQKNWNY